MAPRILMIDDNRDMMTRGKLMLEREGFEVLSAYGDEEGLQVLNKEGDIGLVLLDTRMVGSGWQFLKTLRKREKHARTPIVELTARHYLSRDYLAKTCLARLRKPC